MLFQLVIQPLLMQPVVRRILVTASLCLGLLILPWWLIVCGALCALVRYRFYVEIFVISLILDSLYLPVTYSFMEQWIFTLSAGVLFVLTYFIQSVVLRKADLRY